MREVADQEGPAPMEPGRPRRRRRRQAAFALVRLRQPTAPLRALPDFLVIGAQRAGTSSLFKYLSDHPSVAAPLRKEINYFSRDYGRGPAWYRAHFPLKGRRTTFEATPDYLLHPLAAERAAATVPAAKIVALLRDPVDRAFSHHQHMVRLGFESLPFDEAVAQEPSRLSGEADRVAGDPSYAGRSYFRYSYLERSRYAPQLRRWLAVYPRDRVLVLFAEDLYRDPAATYAGLLEFLDLPPHEPADYRNHSYRTDSTRQASRAPDDTRARLHREFAADDAELADLLGRQVPWRPSP